MRGAGRQQGRILCLPEPPQIIEADSTRGAGTLRRGHLLRQQLQIRVEADRRRALQDRHRRERQDRAANDGEEGVGVLQGTQEVQKGRKGLGQGYQCLEQEILRPKEEQRVVRRHHLHPHEGRMALPGHLPRPVLAKDSRMASVPPRINENLVIDALDNAVNRENPEEGLMVHADRRQPVHLEQVLQGARESRVRPIVFPQGLPLRQRRHGVVLQDPEKGSFPSIAGTTPG